MNSTWGGFTAAEYRQEYAIGIDEQHDRGYDDSGDAEHEDVVD